LKCVDKSRDQRGFGEKAGRKRAKGVCTWIEKFGLGKAKKNTVGKGGNRGLVTACQQYGKAAHDLIGPDWAIEQLWTDSSPIGPTERDSVVKKKKT